MNKIEQVSSICHQMSLPGGSQVNKKFEQVVLPKLLSLRMSVPFEFEFLDV